MQATLAKSFISFTTFFFLYNLFSLKFWKYMCCIGKRLGARVIGLFVHAPDTWLQFSGFPPTAKKLDIYKEMTPCISIHFIICLLLIYLSLSRFSSLFLFLLHSFPFSFLPIISKITLKFLCTIFAFFLSYIFSFCFHCLQFKVPIIPDHIFSFFLCDIDPFPLFVA